MMLTRKLAYLIVVALSIPSFTLDQFANLLILSSRRLISGDCHSTLSGWASLTSFGSDHNLIRAVAAEAAEVDPANPPIQSPPAPPLVLASPAAATTTTSPSEATPTRGPYHQKLDDADVERLRGDMDADAYRKIVAEREAQVKRVWQGHDHGHDRVPQNSYIPEPIKPGFEANPGGFNPAAPKYANNQKPDDHASSPEQENQPAVPPSVEKVVAANPHGNSPPQPQPEMHMDHSHPKMPHRDGIPLDQIDVSKLTPSELKALRAQQQYMQKHKGHEKQHAQMALMLMAGLVASQFIILLWKNSHPKSFQLASLLGLWIVPAAIGFSAGNYRYLFFWILFSLANGVVVRKALFENPMQSSTPRLVYRWYSYVYNASVAVGGFGYFMILVSFFHLPSLLFGVHDKTELTMFQGGIIILFYGLYFGTLGRDFVDRLSDRMAMSMGYYNRTGFPKKHLRPNVCAICGDTTEIAPRSRNGITTTSSSDPRPLSDKVIKLTCEHPFHESCIRGWTIIGKKDCCPYCKEKVDMKAFSRHAWDTTQILYLNLLDLLRYLIVWNPILFMIMHLIFNVLGYD